MTNKGGTPKPSATLPKPETNTSASQPEKDNLPKDGKKEEEDEEEEETEKVVIKLLCFLKLIP